MLWLIHRNVELKQLLEDLRLTSAALKMTNSWVNVSHFQHPQCCYSQLCKSHQNDSTARARGCHFFPNRCQTSISRRKRCEQDDPSWLGGSVQNPDIAQLAMMAETLRAAGCKDGIIFRAQITPLEFSLCIRMTVCTHHLQRGCMTGEYYSCVQIAKWKNSPPSICVSR